MADLFLTDSKGRYHRVCFQAFGMSCGPASVAMVERLYKHLNQSDEQRALDLSARYPGGFTMDGGTYSRNLSSVLNAEGVKAYQSTNVGSESVYSYLKCYSSFATPVIAHVRWSNNAGAHFVVCAIADSDDTFVFYDPWYGVVEVAGWQFPNYYTSDGSGAFSGFLVITYR
jgi:predicted double-glycine peptidase